MNSTRAKRKKSLGEIVGCHFRRMFCEPEELPRRGIVVYRKYESDAIREIIESAYSTYFYAMGTIPTYKITAIEETSNRAFRVLYGDAHGNCKVEIPGDTSGYLATVKS